MIARLTKAPMRWRLSIFLATFALHSLEEVLRFAAWRNMPMARPDADRTTFAISVILLTGFVAAILTIAVLKRNQGAWGCLVAILAGGLLVNAAGHAVLSLVAGAAGPGFYSGVIFVAPSAAWVLAGFGARHRLIALVLGAAAMPAVALGSLALARFLVVWFS